MPVILKFDTNEPSTVQTEWLEGATTASQLKKFYVMQYQKTNPSIQIGSERYAAAMNKIDTFLAYKKPNDEIRFFKTPDGNAGYVILREGKSVQFLRAK